MTAHPIDDAVQAILTTPLATPEAIDSHYDRARTAAELRAAAFLSGHHVAPQAPAVPDNALLPGDLVECGDTPSAAGGQETFATHLLAHSVGPSGAQRFHVRLHDSPPRVIAESVRTGVTARLGITGAERVGGAETRGQVRTTPFRRDPARVHTDGRVRVPYPLTEAVAMQAIQEGRPRDNRADDADIATAAAATDAGRRELRAHRVFGDSQMEMDMCHAEGGNTVIGLAPDGAWAIVGWDAVSTTRAALAEHDPEVTRAQSEDAVALSLGVPRYRLIVGQQNGHYHMDLVVTPWAPMLTTFGTVSHQAMLVNDSGLACTAVRAQMLNPVNLRAYLWDRATEAGRCVASYQEAALHSAVDTIVETLRAAADAWEAGTLAPPDTDPSRGTCLNGDAGTDTHTVLFQRPQALWPLSPQLPPITCAYRQLLYAASDRWDGYIALQEYAGRCALTELGLVTDLSAQGWPVFQVPMTFMAPSRSPRNLATVAVFGNGIGGLERVPEGPYRPYFLSLGAWQAPPLVGATRRRYPGIEHHTVPDGAALEQLFRDHLPAPAPGTPAVQVTLFPQDVSTPVLDAQAGLHCMTRIHPRRGQT